MCTAIAKNACSLITGALGVAGRLIEKRIKMMMNVSDLIEMFFLTNLVSSGLTLLNVNSRPLIRVKLD